MIKKQFLAIACSFCLLLGFATPAEAQTASPTLAIESTTSGEASPSAHLATASAIVEPNPERPATDLTEPTSPSQDSLTEFLFQKTSGSFTWYSPLQYGVRRAVQNGIPVNILVLILLFPVITAIISVSRHVIGLKGFGIYTPAVLSVAFLSTGIFNGILVFMITLAASTIMKKILRRLKLQYLPRTAMLLWGVSILMVLTLIGLSFFPMASVFSIRIFPLLIIMLLTENFLESQLTGSPTEARQLTTETLILAIICSVIIGLEPVQQFVLLRPELTLLMVAALNMIVGRYTGLRLLEWLRFRNIIDQ